MKFYYYRISNVENGRFYIGITTDFEKRKKQHFKQLSGQIHPNYKLQADFNIYGMQAFKMEVIDEFDGTEEQGYQKEYELIQKYKATESYNILEGGQLNPVYSPQCLAKLKQSHQEKYDNILQYRFDGHQFHFINEYGSIHDAANLTNCDFRAIQRCLVNAQQHHGFFWIKSKEKDAWLQTFLKRFTCCVARIDETNGEIIDSALTINEFAQKYNTTYNRIYASLIQNNRCERKYKFIRISANQFAELNKLSL